MFKFAQGKTYGVMVDVRDYAPKRRLILKRLGNKKGIYVTSNLVCLEVQKFFKKSGVSLSNVFVVDVIGKKVGVSKESGCFLTNGPESLTELSIVLLELFRTDKYAFLIFDAASFLLIYNEVNVLIRFFQYLIAQMNYFNITGIIFFTRDAASKELVARLAPFCEKCE